MKFNDFFQTNYLRAEDLDRKDMVLTIKGVEGKEFEDGAKPVVGFEETKKGLILNRTNFRSIAQLHGDSTELWIGKKIILFPTEVSFRGNPTMAIRIRLTPPEAAHSLDEKEVPF